MKEALTKRASELGHKGRSKYVLVTCVDCSKKRYIEARRAHLYLHCRPCADILRSHWKYDRLGYTFIRLYPEDPLYVMATFHGDFAIEHRYVMAQHLGRPLESGEIVHHKNGIRDDNHIENLELTTRFAHIKDHNKGYQHGYAQGLVDGHEERIKKLEMRVTLLEAENALLKMQPIGAPDV